MSVQGKNKMDCKQHAFIARASSAAGWRGIALLLFAVLVAGPGSAAGARAGGEAAPLPGNAAAKQTFGYIPLELDIGPEMFKGGTDYFPAMAISIRSGGFIVPQFELTGEVTFSLIFLNGVSFGFDYKPDVAVFYHVIASACYYPIASPGPFFEAGIGVQFYFYDYVPFPSLALKTGVGYRYNLSTNFSLAFRAAWMGILTFEGRNGRNVYIVHELIGSVGIAWLR